MLDYNIVHILTSPIIVVSVYILMKTFFKSPPKSKRLEIGLYIIYFLTTATLIFITRMPVIVILFNLIMLFIISFNYSINTLNRIILVFSVYILIMIIEILVSSLFGFYNNSLFENSEFNSAIGLVLIRTITLIFSYVLFKLKGNRNNNYKVPQIYLLAFIIILFFTLYLFLTSLNRTEITFRNVVIGSIALIVINTSVILIDERIYSAIILNSENKILKMQNIAYEKQTEIINQSNRSIKILKHDMKNHLNMLNEMFKNNKRHEIEKYMKEIVDEIGKRNISESGNFAIDSILNFKLSQFEDIKLFIDVKIPQTIGISATDITIILGNLLDNAIKATLKTDEKLLKIKISCKLENLVILIDNSYNKEYQDTNLTNIENNSEHGLGLISVKNALEKYGGEIQIKQTDSLFMVSAIIPFNRQ